MAILNTAARRALDQVLWTDGRAREHIVVTNFHAGHHHQECARPVRHGGGAGTEWRDDAERGCERSGRQVHASAEHERSVVELRLEWPAAHVDGGA